MGFHTKIKRKKPTKWLVVERKTMDNFWVIIDDDRTLGCEVIARNPEAGKIILSAFKGRIEGLCLDFDLNSPKGNGLDVAKWALENDCLPPQIQIVSSLPNGRKFLSEFLEENGYVFVESENLYTNK